MPGGLAVNAQATLVRLLGKPRCPAGRLGALRRLLSRSGGGNGRSRTAHEQLLEAAARQPELTRYLRDEGIARVYPPMRTYVM